MSKNFALVGKKYHLKLADRDYYADLLFYHHTLQSYIVVQLNPGNFEPGDIGELSFYIALVDDFVRSPEDNQTLGLLLCKTKNDAAVEYTLRGFTAQIGVVEYPKETIIKFLEELQSSLPNITGIEAELEKSEIFDEHGV